MKKTKSAALLSMSALLLLSACSGGGESGHASSDSSSSEHLSSSSEEIRTDYVMSNTAEGILSAFKEMKKNFNYSLWNSYDCSDYQFTKKFYTAFVNGSTTKYVNLPHHKDPSKNVAYVVSEPANGDPFVSALAYVQDVYGDRSEILFDTYNFMAGFVDDTDASVFEEDNGVFTTDDSGILAPFITLYGTSSIATISFWVDNKGKNLNFELFGSSGTSLTTGYLYSIDNTHDEALEKLADNFSWDSEGKALTKAQAGSMFDANFSGTTKVYLNSSLIASIDFKCNEDTLYINAQNDPNNEGKRYISYIKERESDGRAISYGLTPQNEQISEETRYFFSEYDLPSKLDINDFRLCGDGKYRYFSIETGDVYKTYSHVSVNDSYCDFSEVTLNMENGKVASISSKSTVSSSLVYEAVTTFNVYDGISLPSSYEEEGPSVMKRAMSYFDGAYEHPFQIVKTNKERNAASRTVYTFDGTTYVIQNETYDSSTKTWNGSLNGYTTNEKGEVIAFRRIEGKDKLVQSEDIIEGDKIANYFPKAADPKTIAKNADGTYSFKELVTEVSSTLWLASTAIANTVVMTTNSKGLIDTIKAQVLYTASGVEYLSFAYDDISLPEGLDVSNIGPMELTCYEDDTPDEWSDLVTYIGEEYASLIPYYYDKKNVGNWFAEPCYSSGTGVPDGGLSYDEAPLIGVNFYCFGSEVETSVLDEGFEKNGFKKISDGSKIDVGYRDDDYIANGRDSDVYLVDTSKQSVWVLEGKLRVIYNNEIPWHHFNPAYGNKVTLGAGSDTVLDQDTLTGSREVDYTLGSGLLIQKIDGTEINRNGTFH